MQEELEALNIPFVLLEGDAQDNIPKLAKQLKSGLVVTDFSPLRIGGLWRKSVGESLAAAHICLHEVDAHNIVPVWVASPKLEYAARTIRKKLHDRMPQYLTEFPDLQEHPIRSPDLKRWCSASGAISAIDWAAVEQSVAADRTVPPVKFLKAGQEAAALQLENFIRNIKGYSTNRNDPTLDCVSNLSPYFHFGQLSAQRAILAARAARNSTNSSDIDSFIEEAFVRRELSDNYCFYNSAGYDRIDGLYPQYANDSWAQRSLREHASDKREIVYNLQQLDEGETHDSLWNAAQLEMKHTGKMHGFMRMYWAKKILEWTATPQDALDAAIYLNDRYSIDGRDPNGYVGIAWSIGGVHDQGWKERPVFGKVRFMNFTGCKRKFDVAKYIAKINSSIKSVVK